jgi:hypothetical protein
VRALEEKMILARRIVERLRKANQTPAASMFERRAEQAERSSNAIRELLLGKEKGELAQQSMNENTDELIVS